MMKASWQPCRRDVLKLSAAGLLTNAAVPWFEALATDALSPVYLQFYMCPVVSTFI